MSREERDDAIRFFREVAEREIGNAKYSKLAIEALEQTRWIPVSERLPEDREIILFSTKRGHVFEGKYFDDNTDRQWYSFRNEVFVWNDDVTAWMPSPEAYNARK